MEQETTQAYKDWLNSKHTQTLLESLRKSSQSYQNQWMSGIWTEKPNVALRCSGYCQAFQDIIDTIEMMQPREEENVSE